MEEKVKKIIEEPLKKLNMVVDTISFEKGNLNIVLDSDEVIDLDRITEAGHLINTVLDKESNIRDDYMIDISSKEKGGN